MSRQAEAGEETVYWLTPKGEANKQFLHQLRLEAIKVFICQTMNAIFGFLHKKKMAFLPCDLRHQFLAGNIVYMVTMVTKVFLVHLGGQ